MGTIALGFWLWGDAAKVHVLPEGGDVARGTVGERNSRLPRPGIGMCMISTSSEPLTRRSLLDLELRSNSSEKMLS